VASLFRSRGEGSVCRYKGRAGISVKIQTKVDDDSVFTETIAATSGSKGLTTKALLI